MINFFSKTQSAFGLDLSASSLKIFEFEKKSKQLMIKAYGETLLPKGLMVNDAITDVTTFQYLLKQALDKPQFGHINTNYVVASLPESKSFVRVIQIPHMSDAEAENAVPFEAESFIPLPIDQVYLDWQKVGDDGEKMNILIIASPREFVDGYLGILEKSGLKPIAFEVESQSCHRALVGTGSHDTVLMVDIAAFRTGLIMVEDGNLQFTSTIPIAGNTFTESIARNLGVSSAKADMIKKKVGIANTTEYPNIKTALVPVLNNLSAEIKNILKFHGEHSEKIVTKLLLAGGSAQLKNLAEYLVPEFAEMPELKVEVGNPWVSVPGIKNPPLDAAEALNYTTAIGLALRAVNFIP